MTESALEGCREFLNTLGESYRLRTVKTYRVDRSVADDVPVVPCLDHEAKLRASVAPHVAAYVEDPEGGGLHEVGCYPTESRLVVDLVSTDGEHDAASQDRLMKRLAEKFPGRQVHQQGFSRLRGDRRVLEVAHAQVPLREVLTGEDLDHARRGVERLRAVATLMEKESRVASWGVRTAGTPILAAAGVVVYLLLGLFGKALGPVTMEGLRYAALGLLGGALLYIGLMAVHLTEVANRLWKRQAEYDLILVERRRREG